MVAFVVGIGNYKLHPKLKNPRKDAMAMRDVLKGKNAEIYYAEDCDIDEFEECFGLFVAAIRPGDAAFLFYAGHAVMLNNSLRLMAISNDSASTQEEAKSSAADIESNSLNLDKMIARSMIDCTPDWFCGYRHLCCGVVCIHVDSIELKKACLITGFLDCCREFKTRGGTYERASQSISSHFCLLYTSPSPRDRQKSRMPSSA